MTYLLAKYAIVFLLTALFGFLLGRWWVRRSFVDVSDSYETISKAASADVPWDSLWARFDSVDTNVRRIVHDELEARPQPEFPRVDLEPIQRSLIDLESQVTAIPVPEKPERVSLEPVNRRMDEIEALIKNLPRPEKPAPVDFTSVYQGIADLRARIDGLPVPERAEPVDLSSINRAIAALDARIAALPVPEKPEPIDLSAVSQNLQSLESRVAAIPTPKATIPVDFGPVNARIDAIDALIRNLPKPATPESVDLAPVHQRLERLEAAVKNLPQPTKVDLAPLDHRIGGVEAAVRGIRIPAAAELGPVNERLQIIESHVTQLAKRSAPPPRSLRLFKSASFGKADDLKRISGVGPKLERLLNSHGVHYFWQVADWSKADVTTMDDRLDVFKGRITRDEWVRQAKALSQEASTADRPSAEQFESLGAEAHL